MGNLPRKLRRQRIEAELSSLELLMASLPADDVFSLLSLRERKNDLISELNEMEVDFSGVTTAALLFSGDPIIGDTGIDYYFSGKVISLFQEAFENYSSDYIGTSLAKKAVNSNIPQLYITGVARGSFGFVVQDMSEQTELFKTKTSDLLENFSKMLKGFCSSDDDLFKESIDFMEIKSIKTSGKFVKYMADSGVNFNFIINDTENFFQNSELKLGETRAENAEIQEESLSLRAELLGILPISHSFELRNENGDIIKGGVSRDISSSVLENYSRASGSFVNVNLIKRTINYEDERVKTSYKLISFGDE